jgi:CP family cyanate transporter-like MFS transporter
MLGLAGRLVKQPLAYVATGTLAFVSLIGMMVMSGAWIVFWTGLLGFANTITLVLALALPSILSAPEDVHRTSAGMFTVSYGMAMVLSVIGGWLWDFTHIPLASFAPVALSALAIVALASTANHPDHPANES